MANSLKDLMEKRLKQAGVYHQAQAALIVDQANKALKEVFQPDIFQHARAIYFKQGKIYFEVMNSVVKQELKFKEDQIITKINNNFDQAPVREIKFLV